MQLITAFLGETTLFWNPTNFLSSLFDLASSSRAHTPVIDRSIKEDIDVPLDSDITLAADRSGWKSLRYCPPPIIMNLNASS